MIRFLLNRIWSACTVLFGVVVLVFVLFILLPSADELTAGQRSDATTKEAMRKEMGLDKSVGMQFLFYLNDLSPISLYNLQNEQRGITLVEISGKRVELKWPYFRKSYQSRKNVGDIIREAFPGTFVLALASMGIAFIGGLLFGIIAALYKDKWPDHLAVFISTIGISVPSFFMAILVAWLFGFVLHETTGLSMTGSLFELNPVNGKEILQLQNLILPAFALGLRPFAIIMQLTRNSLLDVMQQDYIRTAKSKGLSTTDVIWKHALRNVLNPVVTATSGWFAGLLAGSFFVEYVFNWKGIGKVTIDALQQSDLPVAMGAVLMSAFVFVVINLIVDMLYTVLDPRVTLNP